MWDQINPWLVGGGLALGLAFGIVAQRSRFCVVAAVSNFALMRDYRQLHAYLAACAAMAVAGTFALEWSNLAAIADTAYRRPTLNWMGALGGGLSFSFGAMLAGGCASRTLNQHCGGQSGRSPDADGLCDSGHGDSVRRPGPAAPVRVLAHALPLAGGDASLSVIMHWPAWILPLGVCFVCLAVISVTGRLA